MSILKKGTKAYSIVHLKCPRCHEGDLFETCSFSFSKPFEMPEKCPVCGQPYFLEPGFYYGAMFVSYILTAFYSLALTGLLILVAGLGWELAFGIMLATLVVLFVWFFRVSRAVWINVNVKYRG